MEQISQEFHDAGVPYLTERHVDVRQVGRRLVTQLEHRSQPPVQQMKLESMIVVADDLGPHRALELLDQGIAAIVVQSGSPTSHLALLCRAFNCPALVGVEGALNLLADDDDILLDLDRSLLVRNPDPADLPAFTVRQESEAPSVEAAITSCGEPITLLANVDVRQALDLAEAQKAQGVGLFRSEFLWRDGREPSESLQQETYEHLLQRMDNVTIRTFDIGSDKIPSVGRQEPNPALGLRALRRYQREPDVFDRQVACMMRAALETQRQLCIMLPMVDGIDSFRWAEARIEEVAERLTCQRGLHYQLGVMIELPAALFQLGTLADAADFFCLGTNDLVQYLLAVDRENPELSEAADPRHPAVLAAIEQVYHAAQSAGIDCTCCGDFAATEAGAVLLLGCGARRLSLPPAELQEMTRFLRLLTLEEAEAIAKKALSLTTRQQLRHYLERVIPALSSGGRRRGLERELGSIGPE